MSLTEAVFTRFWATMTERYGARWITSYGEKPTHAWRETLSAFTPAQISLAIEALSKRQETQDFPPTEPAFKALLVAAAKPRPAEDPAELRRGYWRSSIVNAVAHALGYTVASFEPVLTANRHSLGLAMKTLLDDVDELEATTGQRTAGQEAMVERRCREIVAAFHQLKRARAA